MVLDKLLDKGFSEISWELLEYEGLNFKEGQSSWNHDISTAASAGSIFITSNRD